MSYTDEEREALYFMRGINVHGRIAGFSDARVDATGGLPMAIRRQWVKLRAHKRCGDPKCLVLTLTHLGERELEAFLKMLVIAAG